MKFEFMSKLILVALLYAPAHTEICLAQASGNIGYTGSREVMTPAQMERTKRQLTPGEIPPSGTSTFLEASVLMNVKADEYVAVFGVAQEGNSVAEAQQKMDATLREFSSALKAHGIAEDDVFVDFAAQNKIYDYKIEGDVAKETLTGFEIKKNVAIHYKDNALLDKIVLAASQSQIFDLIKVDYIIKDTGAIHDRLAVEAAGIIKQKAARQEKLLGVKLQSPPQVYAEKPSIYYPTSMYDSYVAYEAENVESSYNRSKYTLQRARKSRTFFFNPLTADSFDLVINPVVLEPVVQFTLYLKVKYEMQLPNKRAK